MSDNIPIPPKEDIKKADPPKDPSSAKGFQWWRRTFQYKSGVGLTPAEKTQYENDYQYILQRQQCQTCYEYRDWMLKYSPTVRFMAQQISKLNSKSNNGEVLPFDESKIICDV